MVENIKNPEEKYFLLAARLGHIHRILLILRSDELRQFGISHPQLAILLRIAASNNDLTPAKLGRDMLRKPNTISVILKRMIENGLVQKQPDPLKKNSQLLSLTPKGHRIVDQYKRDRIVVKVFSQLSEEHLAQLEKSIIELDMVATQELAQLQKQSEYVGGELGSEPI